MFETIQPSSYRDFDGRTVSVVYNGGVRQLTEELLEIEWDGIADPYTNQQAVVKLYRNAKYNDGMFQQKWVELQHVTIMLIVHGYRRFKLFSLHQECPDIRVQFENGDLAYIEVADVVQSDSAKFSSIMSYLNRKVRERMNDDVAFQKMLAGKYFGFRAWPSESWDYRPKQMLQELDDFFASNDYIEGEEAELIKISPKYPLLSGLNLRYYYKPFKHFNIPQIQLEAHAYGLNDSDNTMKEQIDKKIENAATYKGSPLWLLLYIADEQTVPFDNLQSIKDLPLYLGPFQKLFVGEDWFSLCFTVQEGALQ